MYSYLENTVKEDLESSNFIGNFLNKYNINSKPLTSVDEKIKLGFTYYRVMKEYSLFNFPKSWILPLMLLWEFLKPTIDETHLRLLKV